MRLIQLLKWGGVALAALAALFCVLLYMLAARSLPNYDAEFRTPELLAEVEILRDRRAVPHIFGQSEKDIFFALGFAHAQDRLWQMELTRRAAKGRLSEFAPEWLISVSYDGDPEQAKQLILLIDETARALDLHGAATQSYAALDRESQSALEAYSAGVNAWLRVVNEDAKGGGAPELMMLGAALEPWRPEDSLAVLKVAAAMHAEPLLGELSRGRFMLEAQAYTDDLFPGGSPSAFVGGGSGWAVAPDRSSSKAPLLATDADAPLLAPGLWYVARLEFGDGGVIGATLPGAPVVFAGRNEHIAWGFASFPMDTADLYIERVNPENPAQYQTPEGWTPFERRTETIALGDGEAIEAPLLATRHGPVLPLSWPQLARITPENHAISLSWTVLADDDVTIGAMLRLMRSKSVDAVLELRPRFVAPAQMLLVADKDGIAAMAVGRVPLRQAKATSEGGALPSAGWLQQNAWIGSVPADRLPLIRDPSSGVIALADGAGLPADELAQFGVDWPDPYRFMRLQSQLAKRPYHTLSGMRSLQADVGSEMVREILPLIAGPLWEDLGGAPTRRREALELLRGWYGDGEDLLMDRLSPEPLIFTAWIRELTRRLAADELRGDLSGFAGIRPRFLKRVYSDEDGAAARWCDDQQTPEDESCREIAELALDAALEELTAQYGERMSSWRWGRAHGASHAHLAFGEASVFSILYSIEHELEGGAYTLRRSGFLGFGPTPYRTVRASAFRAVYDFGDLDRSGYAISTGQSGHVLSRHFDDSSALWRSGEYAPLSLSRREAETGAIGRTRLLPAE